MQRYIHNEELNGLADFFSNFFEHLSSFDERYNDLRAEIVANRDVCTNKVEFDDYAGHVKSTLKDAFAQFEKKKLPIEEFINKYNTAIADIPYSQEPDTAEEVYEGLTLRAEQFRDQILKLLKATSFKSKTTDDKSLIPLPGVQSSDILILCYAIDFHLDPPEQLEEDRRNPKLISRKDLVKYIVSNFGKSNGEKFSEHKTYKKPDGGLSFGQHDRVLDFLDGIREAIIDQKNAVAVSLDKNITEDPDLLAKTKSTDFWPAKGNSKKK